VPTDCEATCVAAATATNKARVRNLLLIILIKERGDKKEGVKKVMEREKRD
jgi:hypothetical protein